MLRASRWRWTFGRSFQAECSGGIGLDPNVLYQFKIATRGVTSNSIKEDTVIQFTADTTGSSQQITLYGPAAPNEVGTTNTLVAKTGTFAFGKVAKLKRPHQRLRRAAARSVLLRSRAVLQDHSRSQLHEPPAPAAGERDVVPFRIGDQQIILNGVNYGTAKSNGCVIMKPHDYLTPYDVLSIVIEMPKKMLAPSSGSPGVIALWATTGTPNGRAE